MSSTAVLRLIVWLLARRQPLRRRVPELLAVALGGIFSFAMLLLAPRAE
jgi:hypothetical protein